ncbi:phage tail spike protein [Paenibacillus sp. GCM10027626]|uniref:phage tail spike protein n=1 Tax=Paenibacillus sp. GCM10027626 TaxID=3273411 RepID=UPI00362B65E7
MYEINFNDLSYKDTRFFLCKPNREPIAQLHFTLNEKIIMNYGGVNELQLTIPYSITTETGQSKRNPIIDLITGDYLVRHDFKGKTIDYYIITNPEDHASEDDQQDKTITCYQLHYEWKNKLVRILKGTMPLYDPVGDNGVLNKTLLYKTDWTIDYMDGSLLTKYRTFDTGEKDLLSFIFEAIDTYGFYIPVVDTVNKRLSIYLDENYGRDEGLTIEYGKYLKSINGKENFDDVVTRLYVYGKDEISINRLTPAGTDYIESLDYYMHPYAQDANGNTFQHSRYLSDELCEALMKYNKLLDEKSKQFQSLLADEEAQVNERTKRENELTALQTELYKLQDRKDVLVSLGEDLTQINLQITAQQAQIDSKNKEITAIQNKLASIDSQKQSLRKQIAIENNFTSVQIKERNYYIRERVWRDANYSSPEDLLEQAKKNLLLWSQPQVAYEINAIDIINQLNLTYDRDRLKLGSIITIRYPDFGIDIQAKIIVIDHDIRNNGLTLTIANSKDIKSGFHKIKDLLNRSVNTSTQVDMSRYKWDLSEENNTEIDKILNNAWNANKNAIEGGDNLQYLLDRRGLTIKKPDDPLKFLRAVNSVLAITNDGGNTYKNAITSNGITGELIIGKIIAGELLVIQNKAGSVKIDNDGLTVTNMDLTITRDDKKSRIVINAKNDATTGGFRIQSSSNGTTWTDKLYADTTGNLIMTGNISIGTGNEIFKADDKGIYLGSPSFANAPFSVSPAGFLKATNGSFEGNITAKGTITGGKYKDGEIVGSSINVNDGVFKVEKDGSMTATSGRFTGTISGSTISGSLFITSPIPVGRRIEMDSNGFRTFDSGNKLRVSINTSDDKGISGITFYDQLGNFAGEINTYTENNYQRLGIGATKFHLSSNEIFMGSNDTTNPITLQGTTKMMGNASVQFDLTVRKRDLLKELDGLDTRISAVERKLDTKASNTHKHTVKTNDHNHGNTQNSNSGGGTWTSSEPI